MPGIPSDGEVGLSARSVTYVHRTIRDALDNAVRMQLVSRNVADLVIVPRVKKYTPRVYDEEMLVKLLEAVKGTDLELPVTPAASLGLRRGELLGLRWSSIDLERLTSSLVHTSKGPVLKTPKSEQSARTIDLRDSVIALARRHKSLQAENCLKLGSEYCQDGFVCCKPDGTAYTPGYLSKKVAAFLRRKGFPPIRLHDLRHSNATLMLKHGVPAKIASQRLGHSTIAITLDLYSHVIGDMQRETADKVDSSILTKAGLG